MFISLFVLIVSQNVVYAGNEEAHFQKDSYKYSISAVDINTGDLVIAEGDQNYLYEPSTTFKPIIAAIFLDKTDLQLNSPVDTSTYIAKDYQIFANKKDRSETTFLQAVMALNNPILFRELESFNEAPFIEHLKQFNFNTDFKNKESKCKDLYVIGQNIEVSSIQMAYAYAALWNGGILYNEDSQKSTQLLNSETSEEIKTLINQWSKSEIWEQEYLKNRSKAPGVFSMTPNSENNTIDLNFAGFIPTEDTTLAIAFSMSCPEGEKISSKQFYQRLFECIDKIEK